MAYRDMLDEDGQRRYDEYWRWYARQKQRGGLVAGAACFAAGAEHEARVLADRADERIREVEEENLKMLQLATECAGVLQRRRGPLEKDMLEALLEKIHGWITRNRG